MKTKEIYDFLGRNIYENVDFYFEEFFNENKELFGDYILDVCCGSGRHSKFFADKKKKVLGIDNDKEFIKIANENKHSKLKFICEDINDFETKEKFDTILFLGNSIAHFSIKDFERISDKFLKGMNNKSILVIEMFSPMEIVIEKGKKWEWNGFEEVLENFSIETGIMKRKISKRGKSIILENYFWLPFILTEILKKRNLKLIKQKRAKNKFILAYKNGK